RGRPACQTASIQLTQKRSQGESIHLGHLPSGSTGATIHEIGKRLKIAAVGRDRVRRLIANARKFREILTEKRWQDYSVRSHPAKSSRARSSCRALRSAFFTPPSSGSSRPKFAFMG